MNVVAFLVAEGVAAGGTSLFTLALADAHAVKHGYRWRGRGFWVVALAGALIGALAMYALGHVVVLCDLRSWSAAQHCTVAWL